MFSKARASLFSLAIIAVLILSAIGPTIAYADDDKPTEGTASQTVVESNSDTNAAGECTVNKETAKKKKAKKKKNRKNESRECNTSEQLADTSATEADAGLIEETVSADTDLLAALPENTSVTVVNANGESEPLASQQAAEAIASTTDPIWCPQGQAPAPGMNGCTPSFSSFTELLNFLAGNTTYQGAGTIYVEQGAYGGSESLIDFNAYNLSNISGSDLTMQGGWDGTANPVDPATASTSNFLNVEFVIGSSTNPWGGSLTINNLVLQDPNQTGLTLYSQNDINLSNVTVENSTNGDGAVLNAGGNVTINNSTFLRNNKAGTRITAGGNVAIANSEFSNPFNQRRQITGLEITSNGSVSLFNVLAIGNRRRGVDIAAGGRVTIGSSQFSETNALNSGVFYGFGLRVVTPDAIDLSFVTANNNFLWGADLDAGGDVNISDSIFDANSTESPTFIDDTGLLVTSGGNVTLNRVEANGNRLIGAVIDAAGFVNIDGSTFSNNRGVTTTGTGSTFHGLGLQVVSASNVTLSGVTASGNGLTGANLLGGNVTITNSKFNSNITGSSADLLGNGMLVSGSGNVVLFNVSMDSNQLNGGTIQTTANTILDTVTATNNGENGVQVEATCTGIINGGTYSGNGQYGLFLVNSALSLSGSPVFANNGLGDIFPPNPSTCALPLAVGGLSGASPTNSNVSSVQQAVSYPTIRHSAVIGISLSAITLNGLMYGITREAISGGTVTSIFVGNYVYVYTVYDSDAEPILDNLQIIALSPAPVMAVAMVAP